MQLKSLNFRFDSTSNARQMLNDQLQAISAEPTSSRSPRAGEFARSASAKFAAPETWRPIGTGHRIVAAAGSFAATGLVLAALWGQGPSLPRNGKLGLPVIQMRLLPAEVPFEGPPAEPEATPRTSRKLLPLRQFQLATPHSIAQPLPSQPAPLTDSTERSITKPLALVPVQGAERADPSEPTASSPLRLDANVMRAAIAESKGMVQRGAEFSGKQIPTAPRSRAENFSSDIKSAGKSDCLAPNKQGNLLSLPMIAYSAISGQCN